MGSSNCAIVAICISCVVNGTTGWSHGGGCSVCEIRSLQTVNVSETRVWPQTTCVDRSSFAVTIALRTLKTRRFGQRAKTLQTWETKVLLWR